MFHVLYIFSDITYKYTNVFFFVCFLFVFGRIIGAVAYLEQLKNSSRRKSSPNSVWPAKKFPRHNTSSDDDEMEYTRNQAFDRSNGYGDSL